MNGGFIASALIQSPSLASNPGLERDIRQGAWS